MMSHTANDDQSKQWAPRQEGQKHL